MLDPSPKREYYVVDHHEGGRQPTYQEALKIATRLSVKYPGAKIHILAPVASLETPAQPPMKMAIGHYYKDEVGRVWRILSRVDNFEHPWVGIIPRRDGQNCKYPTIGCFSEGGIEGFSGRKLVEDVTAAHEMKEAAPSPKSREDQEVPKEPIKLRVGASYLTADGFAVTVSDISWSPALKTKIATACGCKSPPQFYFLDGLPISILHLNSKIIAQLDAPPVRAL